MARGIRWKRASIKDVGMKTLYVDSKTAKLYYNKTKGRQYVRQYRGSYLKEESRLATRVYGGKFPDHPDLVEQKPTFRSGWLKKTDMRGLREAPPRTLDHVQGPMYRRDYGMSKAAAERRGLSFKHTGFNVIIVRYPYSARSVYYAVYARATKERLAWERKHPKRRK